MIDPNNPGAVAPPRARPSWLSSPEMSKPALSLSPADGPILREFSTVEVITLADRAQALLFHDKITGPSLFTLCTLTGKHWQDFPNLAKRWFLWKVFACPKWAGLYKPDTARVGAVKVLNRKPTGKLLHLS